MAKVTQLVRAELCAASHAVAPSPFSPYCYQDPEARLRRRRGKKRSKGRKAFFRDLGFGSNQYVRGARTQVHRCVCVCGVCRGYGYKDKAAGE